MRYVDLVALAVPQVRMALRRTTPDHTDVDEGYLEQCLFMVLAEVDEIHDLDALTIFDAPLFTTQVGVRSYTLPPNFGRFATFKEPLQTGIRVDNGVTTAEMYYEPLLDLSQGAAISNGPPKRFILTDDGLTLDPPPDDNGGSNYTITGTYLQTMDFSLFDMGQEVRLAAPHFLREAAVAKYLGGDETGAISRLVNAEARKKTQFQWSYHPQRWRRWRRKGRR